MAYSNTPARSARPDTPWLAWVRNNAQARLRLFCFPYSGGGALAYRPWADGLPGWVELCPVQLPGREGRIREAPFRRTPPLVEAAAQGLLPLFDKPFAFFGHSAGARIAFELARCLRERHGLTPSALFVSGCPAPHLPFAGEPIHALPDAQFVEKLREFNGTPPEVLAHAELMELLLPILRADFEVFETYEFTPAAPLRCPIVAFGGVRDHAVSRDSLDAWREHTAVSFSCHMLEGDHFFLNTARPALLRLLSDMLQGLSSA